MRTVRSNLLRHLCLLAFLSSPVATWGAASFARLHAFEQKSQGYLGIEFHDVAPSNVSTFRLHVEHQVEIIMVDHDGPAGKAGLKAHDVVQSLNGQAVASAEALRQMIHDAGAGSTITLTVLRDGRTRTLIAQLENREDVERRAFAQVSVDSPLTSTDPDREPDKAAGAAPSTSVAVRGKHFLGEVLHGPSVGLQLQAVASQLALYFGAPASGGLLVEAVEAGSPAALAGLQAGDLLLRADSAALRSTSDWTKHLHAGKGRAISLQVLRDHHEITVILRTNAAKSALEWPSHFQGTLSA